MSEGRSEEEEAESLVKHENRELTVEEKLQKAEETVANLRRSLRDEHQHDLVPVHSVLLSLAIQLQKKVSQEIVSIGQVRAELALKMREVAACLRKLGEISLPNGLHLPSSLPDDNPHLPVLNAILSIHKYRDSAVKLLELKADTFAAPPSPPTIEAEPADFNEASDDMDKSFQYLRALLDQIGECARFLQTGEVGQPNLRRFSSELCLQIDALEKEYVLKKMEELTFRTCSIQSRKPVKSIGLTLDFQEIMLLAKNAKSMVYEVSLKLLRVVDTVKAAEINSTALYHTVTKENSELLRRYCFYLKLKIQQL